MYKNVIFLLSTTDLAEHTKEYYKIFSVLLPVYTAVKYEFCRLFRNKIQDCIFCILYKSCSNMLEILKSGQIYEDKRDLES